MTDTIIGIKELHRNLKRVTDAAVKGKSFTVVRDSKPVFRIGPVAGEIGTADTFADMLERLKFRGGKHLSRDIDKIVYGSNR